MSAALKRGVAEGILVQINASYKLSAEAKNKACCWKPSEYDKANALCLGTGRFLRSVLVPTLIGAGLKPALIQTRGRSFMEYMKEFRDAEESYQVDTVLPSGKIETDEFQCWGGYSFGREEDKRSFFNEVLPDLDSISVLGVGVTEAGLASKDTQVMQDLFQLLLCIFDSSPLDDDDNKKNCVSSIWIMFQIMEM